MKHSLSYHLSNWPLQSLAMKLDFFQTQFGKHVVALVMGKVQKCFIPHLKALILSFYELEGQGAWLPHMTATHS